MEYGHSTTGTPVISQIDLWLIHLGEVMKTRLGRRWRARNVAATWFAHVPEIVWIDAVLPWRLGAMGPKTRSFARLVKVGEPAIPRYSWVVSLRCSFAYISFQLLFYSAKWYLTLGKIQGCLFSFAICSGGQWDFLWVRVCFKVGHQTERNVQWGNRDLKISLHHFWAWWCPSTWWPCWRWGWLGCTLEPKKRVDSWVNLNRINRMICLKKWRTWRNLCRNSKGLVVGVYSYENFITKSTISVRGRIE